MRRGSTPRLLAASALALAAAAPAGPDPSASAVLFVSSDLRGYLAPCGCSENMRGGLPRAAHQLMEARAHGAQVLYFDAGDALFGARELPASAVPQQTRKARALAEGMRHMGLRARAVGEKDDARGAAFRRSLGLPELEPGRPAFFEIEGGARIAAVAAADGATLAEGARGAREAGARFVLGLFHGPLGEAQKAAARPDLQADLIVASHADGELAGEENRLVRASVPVAQVQSKGRSLLRIDLSLAEPGERLSLAEGSSDVEREVEALTERIALLDRQINAPDLGEEARALRRDKLAELVERRQSLASRPPASLAGRNAFTVRFVPLEASLPEDGAARAILDAYDRDVGRLNLAWAKKHGRDCRTTAAGEAGYAGSDSCRGCHAAAFPVWERSKHARAYETLEERGKQFHLDCVSCHVTGFGKPGGVCRVDKVGGRAEVGCESCHGPGSLHARDPKKPIALGNVESACVGCHDAENSTHFDFRTYLPQILGPGHGRSAAAPSGR